MFHYFLELFYHTFVDSHIDQKQILLQMVFFSSACLQIFLVLRKSRANFSISGLLISAPILIFEDLQLSVLYSLSTILFILKQKK